NNPSTVNGDRIMDFSLAGYMGGGVGLPDLPVRQSVSPSGGDDTSAIQAAIDAVAGMTPDANGFRGTVLLAPATFNLVGTLNLPASGVVLRGSGSDPNGTVINLTGSSHTFIRLAGTGSWSQNGAVAITSSYVPSGTDTFTVSSAAGFGVGDTVIVERPV